MKPHSPQNRCPGTIAALQEGHAAARCAPHSWQNLWPGSLSVPQVEQIIRPHPPPVRRRSRTLPSPPFAAARSGTLPRGWRSVGQGRRRRRSVPDRRGRGFGPGNFASLAAIVCPSPAGVRSAWQAPGARRTARLVRPRGGDDGQGRHLPELHGGHRGGVRALQIGVRRRLHHPPADARGAADPAHPISEKEQELVAHIELQILGGTSLMGTDMIESMGQTLRIGNNITISLELGPARRRQPDLHRTVRWRHGHPAPEQDVLGRPLGYLRRPLRRPVDVQRAGCHRLNAVRERNADGQADGQGKAARHRFHDHGHCGRLAGLTGTPSAAAGGPTVTITPWLSSLNAPRGVAFDGAGNFYVAESGVAGSGAAGFTHTGRVSRYSLGSTTPAWQTSTS